MKKLLFLYFLFFFYQNLIWGQCIPIDVVITDTTCQNQNISITNNTSTPLSYEWDFCPGDMAAAPTVALSGKYPTIGRADGLDMINDNQSYYAFVIASSGNLFRLDFGSSFNNTPTVNDLGFVIQGYDISMIKDNVGIWHAYIATTNNKVYRIDFSNGISGAFTTTDLGNFNGIVSSPRAIRAYRSGSDIYIFVTSSNLNTLSIVKFSGGVSGATSTRSFNISGTSQLIGLAVGKECDSFYSIISDVSLQKIFMIDLGSNPLDSTQTTIQEIAPLQGITTYELDVVIENNNYYLLLPSFNGTLYQANFAGSIINTDPTLVNLGDFNVLDRILGAEFLKDSSLVAGMVYNYTTYDLHTITYPNNCNASSPVSQDTAPTGIYYSSPGWQYIEIKGIDNTGGITLYRDSVDILPLPVVNFSTDKTC
ncbi:MAG TPA: hypothetical protein ENJ39_08715, partial [Flammeovirgaceae bacterium]|nr:hypothetical protein [Flammeovirgaceae bacterium]